MKSYYFWSLQILMNALRRMGAVLMGVTTLLVATSVTVWMDMHFTLTSTYAMVVIISTISSFGFGWCIIKACVSDATYSMVTAALANTLMFIFVVVSLL